MLLADGATNFFDTYFGACFESQWRGVTRLASLLLGIDASGSFALRLRRRSAQGETVLLHDELFRDVDGRFSVSVPAPLVPAVGERVFAEVTALEGGCTISGLDWRTPDMQDAVAVGLVPVFCTFGSTACFRKQLVALEQTQAGFAKWLKPRGDDRKDAQAGLCLLDKAKYGKLPRPANPPIGEKALPFGMLLGDSGWEMRNFLSRVMR